MSAAKTSQVLILEPSADGHRMQYVKWSAKALLDRGVSVRLVTTASAVGHPLFQDVQPYCDGKLDVQLMPEVETGHTRGVMGLWARNMAYRRAFASAHKTFGADADCIFIPYFEYCDKAVAVIGPPFGRTPWAGLVMRTSFHYQAAGIKTPPSRRDPIERALFKRVLASRTLKTLFTIDESLAAHVASAMPNLASKIAYVPDPHDLGESMTRPEARTRLGVAEDRFVVLVYGSITERKGIQRLLEALHSTDSPRNVLVVIAGKPDAAASQLMESVASQRAVQGGQLMLLARHMRRDEEEMLFRAADLVWLVYEGHYGSSGVLSLAAAAGVPVVGCEEGLIGRSVRAHRLGLTISNTEDVLSAIQGTLELQQSFASDLRKYARDCSVLAFQSCIANRIAQVPRC